MPLRKAWRQSSSKALTVSGKKGQMRWVGDHRKELEATLVLTELACRYALEVDQVDLGNNLDDGALINSNV
eukprot:5736867-Pleurochrysis_carterae.AAC.1